MLADSRSKQICTPGSPYAVVYVAVGPRVTFAGSSPSESELEGCWFKIQPASARGLTLRDQRGFDPEYIILPGSSLESSMTPIGVRPASLSLPRMSVTLLSSLNLALLQELRLVPRRELLPPDDSIPHKDKTCRTLPRLFTRRKIFTASLLAFPSRLELFKTNSWIGL
jgi:hypothetical protein